MLSAAQLRPGFCRAPQTAPCPWGGEKPETLGAKSRVIYTLDAQAETPGTGWSYKHLSGWASWASTQTSLGCAASEIQKVPSYLSHTAGKVTSCFLWGSVSERLDVSCFNGHEKEKNMTKVWALILKFKGSRVYKSGSLGISLLLTPSAKNASSKWNLIWKSRNYELMILLRNRLDYKFIKNCFHPIQAQYFIFISL